MTSYPTYVSDSLICTQGVNGIGYVLINNDKFMDTFTAPLHNDAQVAISNTFAPLASLEFPDVNLSTSAKVSATAPNFDRGTVKDVELNHGVFDVELANGQHVKYGTAGSPSKFFYGFLI